MTFEQVDAFTSDIMEQLFLLTDHYNSSEEKENSLKVGSKMEEKQ